MPKPLDQTLGVLTGAVGDYLARTGNALATPMTLVQRGEVLASDAAALRRAYARPSSRLAVLIHGLMATEQCFVFDGPGAPRDYGSELEDRGWTALRLRYNTGVSLQRNAADLAALLEQVVQGWPVAVGEIALIGHSLGGLLLREAAAHASQSALRWPALVQHVACLATPHQGAPLERFGRRLSGALRRSADPLAALISQWADVRSVGIQQLGDAPTDFWLPHARHLLVASSLAGPAPLAAVIGDGMVSLQSALAQGPGGREVPRAERHVVRGLHHATLAFSPQVSALLLQWLPAYPLPEPLAASAAEATVEAVAAAPPGRATRGRWIGAAMLVRDAVRHGHRGVERVQLGRADQLLELLSAAVPAAAPGARSLHAVHKGVVVLHHGVLEVGLAAVDVGLALAMPSDKTLGPLRAAGGVGLDPWP